MPSIPHGDRIRELEMLVSSQSTQIESSNKTLDSLVTFHNETVRKLEDHRRETERKIAVLEEKIAKLEGLQHKWTDRLWSIIPPALAAAIAALLTWLFTRNKP